MNILLINHYAGGPQFGMEFRPYYMARMWNSLGHKTRVVAATYSHLRARQPQDVGEPRLEEVGGVEYFWIPTPSYVGNGVGRVKNMLTFTAGLYRYRNEMTSEFRPDVVVASSTYPLDVYPARSIAKKFNARLVFEVHDLWPLSPMVLGGMSRWHPFIVVMQIAENYAYRNSDDVVSFLPKAESHMREHGLQPGKFHYIPNGIDEGDWKKTPLPLPEGLQRHIDDARSSGRFLICYAGSHGIANALDSVVEAAHLTRDENVTYLMVGSGPEKGKLQEQSKRLRLENLTFWDPIPKDAIPTLLSQCDALYVGFQRQELFKFGVSPNKLMDYMMAGKPVIHAVDAGNDLVAESGCGVSIPPEEPGALADAVRALKETAPAELAVMGQKGRDYILKNHTYSVLARKFLEVCGAGQ